MIKKNVLAWITHFRNETDSGKQSSSSQFLLKEKTKGSYGAHSSYSFALVNGLLQK